MLPVLGGSWFAPLKNLLVWLSEGSNEPCTNKLLGRMEFGALRDALIAISPLDVGYMKVVNRADAEFWKKSKGYWVKSNNVLLQFNCGGQVIFKKDARTHTYV